MADNDSGMSFISGFLLGGLVGAAVGLLLAPKSGAETRAGIAEHSDAWRNRAEDLAGQIGHNISPTIDNLRHQVAPAVEVVREKMGMEPAVAPVEPEVASTNGVESEAASANGVEAEPEEESKEAAASKSAAAAS